MSSTYQAVFDAIKNENIGHYFAMAKEDIRMIFSEHATPAAIYRPTLTQDGNAWLAIYGDLPTGVVGTGRSPEEARKKPCRILIKNGSNQPPSAAFSCAFIPEPA